MNSIGVKDSQCKLSNPRPMTKEGRLPRNISNVERMKSLPHGHVRGRACTDMNATIPIITMNHGDGMVPGTRLIEEHRQPEVSRKSQQGMSAGTGTVPPKADGIHEGGGQEQHESARARVDNWTMRYGEAVSEHGATSGGQKRQPLSAG